MPYSFATRMMRIRAIDTGTPKHLALLQATEAITGLDDLLSKSRQRKHVRARQTLMCAARMYGATLEQAALFAGLYDHTTASWAVERMSRDEALKKDALAVLTHAKELLAARDLRFNDGVAAMAAAVRPAKHRKTRKNNNSGTVGAPEKKPARPDVVELTRKPWEGDSPEAREIARRREQHYG
jgi:hypothetical protein